MQHTYNRRQLLRMGLGSLIGLSALDLAACATDTTSATTTTVAANARLSTQPVSLFMVFWGSATRNTLTRNAINFFQKAYPNVTIGSSYSGNDVYYTKLNARIAANNAPDLIQMDMRYIAQYVRKGELLDLTNLIYNQTINLSDFDPVLLDSSKVNNTLYGVPLGSNYQCMFYSQTLIDKAGLPLPANMTWDTFQAYTTELSQRLGDGNYGTSDNSGNYDNFEVWIRQHNKELYTRDGQLAFALEDVAEWYDYWNTMRKNNACIPTNLQAKLDLTQTPTDSSVVKGQAVFSHFFSNQFVTFQKATSQKLKIAVYPSGNSAGSTPGPYLKASQLISISSATKHPEEAAAFVSFLTNNPDAVEALGFERGVPGSAAGLTYLQPLLSSQELVINDFMTLVRETHGARPKEVLDPPAAGTVATLLQNTSLDIGNGKISVSKGASQFYTAAQAAVNKKAS